MLVEKIKWKKYLEALNTDWRLFENFRKHHVIVWTRFKRLFTHSNEIPYYTIVKNFNDKLSDYQLLKTSLLYGYVTKIKNCAEGGNVIFVTQCRSYDSQNVIVTECMWFV